ncbi:MAG: HAMP domain-containing histidine kinase [Alphaproteobacteria bacterium]|nr:HAMP domain-containing histidine kinase [Alphaproteobacteria bacterium]MBM3652019.1 HAMP domain-containing histidine kinase [Alphaproteobacteria bacterium]
MKRVPSLTARLLAKLLIAQFFVIVALWSFHSVLSSAGLTGALGYSFDDYFSYYRIRDYVVRSIAKAPDGSLYLEPNSELRLERERRPALRYAAFESLGQEPIRGSSLELSTALQSITSVEPRGMDFYLSSGSAQKNPGSLWRWNTRFGPLFVAVSGYAFNWSDPLFAFINSLRSLGWNLFAMFTVSGLVVWLVVHTGLAPLRRAATAADRIDMDTMGQGVPADGVPSEVKPLIDSVNNALSRLDASVTRMRRYTANAAHQLRTPLAIFHAHIEDPEGRTYKTRLKQDVKRMQIIVDQMLITARLNERQSSIDEKVDIVKATCAIIADLAPLAFKSGRRIEFQASTTEVIVRGNRNAIECVVANLIDNAVRAEPEGGTVLVRALSDGTVEVVDHGEGVAVEDRDLIFEPFWRKNEATPGTGLGLAISKELMDRQDGRIWVEETPGGGATFKLCFPAATSETHAILNNLHSSLRTNARS